MKKKVSVADENLFFVVWCWPQMLAAVAVPGPGRGLTGNRHSRIERAISNTIPPLG